MLLHLCERSTNIYIYIYDINTSSGFVKEVIWIRFGSKVVNINGE
jgi:hypothetical protein